MKKRNVGENPSCRCRARRGYRHMGFRLSSAYGVAICVQKALLCQNIQKRYCSEKPYCDVIRGDKGKILSHRDAGNFLAVGEVRASLFSFYPQIRACFLSRYMRQYGRSLKSRSVGWRKGSPEGGEVPAIFIMTGIEIFIDESGDFGPFDVRCPYYIVTMVFHECTDPLYSDIQELEYRLSLLGLEEHCVHSSPAIRGEGAYHGVSLQLRRKLMSNFAAFVRKSKLRYKCFFVRKGQNVQQEQVIASLKEVMESFINENYDRLSSYAPIIVSYDKGQRQLSELIAEMFESRFANVRLTKTLPISSRIFQVADFVCTLKRLMYKLQSEGTLSKSENIFFGTKSNFLKNWIAPIRRLEWQ